MYDVEGIWGKEEGKQTNREKKKQMWRKKASGKDKKQNKWEKGKF